MPPADSNQNLMIILPKSGVKKLERDKAVTLVQYAAMSFRKLGIFWVAFAVQYNILHFSTFVELSFNTQWIQKQSRYMDTLSLQNTCEAHK